MKLKILFLGDASNYHTTLANALRRLGHEVVVASNGSRWMQTQRDINLSRMPGLWGGFKLYAKLQYLCMKELRGFDVVQLHNPIFADLRPHRVREIFDKFRKNNGIICLTALGTDTPYVRMCLEPESPLRYNEFREYGQPTPYALQNPDKEYAYTHPPLSDHTRYIYDKIDGCASALYEYHLALHTVLPRYKYEYIGIPVDAPQEIKTPEIGRGPIRIMAACHKGREKEKGFDRLMKAVERVIDNNPGKAELVLVQNAPYEQFKSILDAAHIVVDQLYSYSPATTALMAMAKGKAVISGGEKEYYDFINEGRLRPIINPDPANLPALEQQLNYLINNPADLRRLMRQGHEFVAKHNSAEIVANRILNFWDNLF